MFVLCGKQEGTDKIRIFDTCSFQLFWIFEDFVPVKDYSNPVWYDIDRNKLYDMNFDEYGNLISYAVKRNGRELYVNLGNNEDILDDDIIDMYKKEYIRIYFESNVPVFDKNFKVIRNDGIVPLFDLLDGSHIVCDCYSDKPFKLSDSEYKNYRNKYKFIEVSEVLKEK